MEPIPDTGGGIPGFVAYLLWHIYRFFPFQGTWDWLVLVVFLAFLIRLAHLPFLWRQVERDMQLLARREATRTFRRSAAKFCRRVGAPMLWVVLFVWLFGTSAGHTFSVGREFGPMRTNSAGTEPWLTAAFAVLLLVTLIVNFLVLSVALTEPRKYKCLSGTTPAPEPQAFRERTLPALFFGGGIREYAKKDDSPTPLEPDVCLGAEAPCCFLAMFVSAFLAGAVGAGRPLDTEQTPMMLALPALYALTYSLFEPVRMLFVYILHKRAFG